MKKSTFSWFAAAGLLLASSAFALERTAALGAAGEIYLAKAGTYGNLFPQGSETQPDNPVLAIDVVKSGSVTQRLLVPFTKEAEPESAPALIYEENSNTLFLVWESRLNSIHSVLMLASFDGDRWSKPIQITGNPFSSKSSPQLAVTRDTYTVTRANGATENRRRTFLHLIWEEEAGSGEYELLYSPVILEEGRYLGWNPIYYLDDLVEDGDSGSGFAPSTSLLQAPTLQSGRDPRTVVVGFASAARRWMTGVVIDVLPVELSQLADKMRSSIIDIGHQGSFPGNRSSVAEKSRAEVIAQGAAFHSDVIRYMADQVHAQILTDRGDDLESLANKMRSSIIDIGVRLGGRGLRGRSAKAKASTQEIVSLENGPDAPPPHLIHFRAVANRPTPQVGSSGLRMFVSEEAEDMIVSWVNQDRVFYRISKDDGWSEELEIRLSDSMSLERAYALLAQRVHGQ